MEYDIKERITEVMGLIHVCDVCVTPCDDPENQMVVTIGSEGSGKFSLGDMYRHVSVERDEESNCCSHPSTLTYKRVVVVKPGG